MSRIDFGALALQLPFAANNLPPNPRIALINIMDNAAGTERHFIRTLRAASPSAEITLCRMACAKLDKKYFTEQEYLCSTKYLDWQDVIGQKDFHLVIVSGINRGTLSYQNLADDYDDFWQESQELFQCIYKNIQAGKIGNAALVCWAAFAAMKVLYGVEKGIHPQKFYGLFPHNIENPTHPLSQGLGTETIFVPQSRSSYMCDKSLRRVIGEHQGDVVMSGPDGPAIWTLESERLTCFINHLEYGIDTLNNEYNRDSKNETNGFPPPQNYRADDPALPAIFDRLENSCASFYKNLIRLSVEQLKKEKSYPCAHEVQADLTLAPPERAFGSKNRHKSL